MAPIHSAIIMEKSNNVEKLMWKEVIWKPLLNLTTLFTYDIYYKLCLYNSLPMCLCSDKVIYVCYLKYKRKKKGFLTKPYPKSNELKCNFILDLWWRPLPLYFVHSFYFKVGVLLNCLICVDREVCVCVCFPNCHSNMKILQCNFCFYSWRLWWVFGHIGCRITFYSQNYTTDEACCSIIDLQLLEWLIWISIGGKASVHNKRAMTRIRLHC